MQEFEQNEAQILGKLLSRMPAEDRRALAMLALVPGSFGLYTAGVSTARVLMVSRVRS